MPKRATAIVLSEKEQEGLLQITKRHRSEQQVVLRARIVLAAAQGFSNAQIARELGVNVDTVRLWRDRWAGLQGIDVETLSEASRMHRIAFSPIAPMPCVSETDVVVLPSPALVGVIAVTQMILPSGLSLSRSSTDSRTFAL